jgi:hypothetical protein
MRQIKFSLLVLTTVLATSLSIHTDRASAQQAPPQVDLVGAGVSIINSLLHPPTDPAKAAADADVRKAEIAARNALEMKKLDLEANKNTDTLTPVLNKWGVARIPCGSGVVTINIGADTVCIQPTASTPAGYYTFDSTKQKLVRSGSTAQSGSTAKNSPAQNSSTAQNSTVQNSSTAQSNTNVQTVQTTQSNNGSRVKTTQTTRVSGSGQHDGF